VGIAVELTEEQGVDGWSMREAARRAGVAHSAPYRHFADREALVDAVAVEGFVELQRRYEAAARTARGRVGAHGSAVAEAVARAYLEYAVDHPNLFALVFSGPERHRSPEARSSYESFVRLTTGFEADAVLTDEALMSAHVLWASVHGIAQLVNAGYFPRDHAVDLVDRLIPPLTSAREPDLTLRRPR
jgi:AcrR family transcriptional regulator